MVRRLVAAALAVLAAVWAPQARADNWGCEVLLCLSNPAGPMAVQECVPPIQRLYRAIFKWRPDPFPTCVMSNGANSATGGNYAFVAPPSYYDECPTGTSSVGQGTYAAAGRRATPEEQAAMPAWQQRPFVVTSGMVLGIGDGSNATADDATGQLPTKVCAGKYLGQTIEILGTGHEDRTTVAVNVYDRVVLMDPAGDTFNINVFVNHGLFRNIRPFTRPTTRDL
jgi:hypothetical protein